MMEKEEMQFRKKLIFMVQFFPLLSSFLLLPLSYFYNYILSSLYGYMLSYPNFFT